MVGVVRSSPSADCSAADPQLALLRALVRNMHGDCRPSQRGMVSAALPEVFTGPRRIASQRATMRIQPIMIMHSALVRGEGRAPTAKVSDEVGRPAQDD